MIVAASIAELEQVRPTSCTARGGCGWKSSIRSRPPVAHWLEDTGKTHMDAKQFRPHFLVPTIISTSSSRNKVQLCPIPLMPELPSTSVDSRSYDKDMQSSTGFQTKKPGPIQQPHPTVEALWRQSRSWLGGSRLQTEKTAVSYNTSR